MYYLNSKFIYCEIDGKKCYNFLRFDVIKVNPIEKERLSLKNYDKMHKI